MADPGLQREDSRPFARRVHQCLLDLLSPPTNRPDVRMRIGPCRQTFHVSPMAMQSRGLRRVSGSQCGFFRFQRVVRFEQQQLALAVPIDVGDSRLHEVWSKGKRHLADVLELAGGRTLAERPRVTVWVLGLRITNSAGSSRATATGLRGARGAGIRVGGDGDGLVGGGVVGGGVAPPAFVIGSIRPGVTRRLPGAASDRVQVIDLKPSHWG